MQMDAEINRYYFDTYARLFIYIVKVSRCIKITKDVSFEKKNQMLLPSGASIRGQNFEGRKFEALRGEVDRVLQKELQQN